MGSGPKEVSTLLADWSNRNESAREELIPLVYAELRPLAGKHMALERGGHSLQATALVNEAPEEIAEVHKISEVTVRRDWSTPKARLSRAMGGENKAPANGG
jgi:hypothetical protein